MRGLLAGLMLMTLVPQAQASEVRNFFAPQFEGQRIGACLADGACGKAAADAFCKVEGYDEAMLFQRERSQSARIIDSGNVCEKDCTSFKQVKCYTVKSDLGTAQSAL